MTRLLVGVSLVLSLLACSGALEDMKAQGETAKAEGAAWAVGKDQGACIDEGLARAMQRGDTEFLYHATNSVWLQSCLEAASPVAGICDGVPDRGEIMPTVEWRMKLCTARGYGENGDQRCHRLMEGLQRHCHPEG